MVFRVRSAQRVRISDIDLIKRLGIIVSFVIVFLSARMVFSPPTVQQGKLECHESGELLDEFRTAALQIYIYMRKVKTV